MNIIYQDKHLLLCEKPAGVLSQPAPGQEESMISLLQSYAGGEIYPVHRLDRGTGGLMVYARTPKTAAALSESIRQRSFVKEYLCVVQGTPAEPSATLTDLLYWDAARGKSFPVTRERKGVKSASLEYVTLGQTENTSLLRVKLHTGRTHQIRVQFASRGMPLLGDIRYGSRDRRCDAALWSFRLCFRHPVQGKTVDITCPPPEQYPWNLFAIKELTQ